MSGAPDVIYAPRASTECPRCGKRAYMDVNMNSGSHKDAYGCRICGWRGLA